MRYEDPNVPASAVVGIVGAILLFVVIVLLQGVFYRMEREERARKLGSEPYETLAQLDATQLEILGSYGFVDPQAGIVRVPIERACQLLVAESTAR